jgi:hypothetical protein
MSRKNRRHRQERMVQGDDSASIPEDDIEISSVEDSLPEREKPEEDPIAVLKREVEATRNEKAEAEKRWAEERQRSQELERQTVNLSTDRLSQDKLLIEQAYTAAEAKGANAKAAYAAAMGEMRWEDAAEAQRAMIQVEHEKQRYFDAYQTIEQRQKEPPRQVTPRQEDDFDARVASIPDANTRQWAKDHKGDLLDQKRLKLAYAADNLAQARGYTPGSDDYLDFLDEQMGYGEEIDDDPPPQRSPVPSVRRPSLPVSAPVSRRSSGGATHSVSLSSTDKMFAKQLGYTEKEYAKIVLNASKTDKFNKYNGRLK